MCGSELKALPDGVQRVAKLLLEKGHPHAPVMLDDAARTAQQAADALGIVVGQIAKSIIFRRKTDDVAVLVITSGDRRVDEKKVQALVCAPDEKLGRADADFVKTKTGFSIGGVSPLAHLHKPVTLIDQELFRFDEIWAAAGHPHAVFKLMPADLVRLTAAPVADVAQVNLAVGPRKTLLERLNEVKNTSPVISPCVSVCKMDATRTLCTGCLRTIPEITAWSRMDDPAKLAVWALIEVRAKAPLFAAML